MKDSPTEELPDFWKAIRNSVASQRGDAIGVRPEGAVVPLSFGQERLWRLHQLQGKSAPQNISQHVRLLGPLNVPALQQTIEFLIDRHEVFRTSIRLHAGKPSQHIETSIPFEIEETDLSSLGAADRALELQSFISEFSSQCLNIERAPLWRYHLIRISDSEHYLLRAVHHLIFDHWSGGIFHRETAVLYAAFAEGQSSPLKALPIQYGDYAVWQRHQLNPVFIETCMKFWKHHFSGRPAPLELPYNNQPSAQSFDRQGGRSVTPISEQLIHSLSILSEDSGMSLFVVFLAVFKILLHACSGQQDLVLCVPVAGRDRVELRRLIGYFNNMIALRSKISPDMTAGDVLCEVSRNTLESQPFQSLPFQKLSEITAREGIQLHRAAFSMLNTPSRPKLMGELSVESIKTANQSEDFELFWAIHHHVDEWSLVVRYRSALFESERIDVLMKNYVTLLEQICMDRRVMVSKLSEVVKL